MTIQPGDTLPDATFRVATADGVQTRSTDDVFKGRTVVLFAVPGAFTPTCHRNHLPGYLTNRDAILAKGVDAIAVTSTNDPFVLAAWARETGGEGKLEFLSDGNADFARAIGLDSDGSAFGMGLRSKRYSMLVRDRVVQSLSVEEKSGTTELSGAERLLASL